MNPHKQVERLLKTALQAVGLARDLVATNWPRDGFNHTLDSLSLTLAARHEHWKAFKDANLPIPKSAHRKA